MNASFDYRDIAYAIVADTCCRRIRNSSDAFKSTLSLTLAFAKQYKYQQDDESHLIDCIEILVLCVFLLYTVMDWIAEVELLATVAG